MYRSLARVLMVLGLAAAAALPVTASAAGGGGGGGTSNGMTITIGSPITLQNKLLITVPVTVTCVDSVSIDPTVTQPGSIGVTVEEASHSTVVVGSGGLELDNCSPTPQTFSIQVTPNPGQTPSAPFHGGQAIVSAAGGICASFLGPCYNASTPWQTTKL